MIFPGLVGGVHGEGDPVADMSASCGLHDFSKTRGIRGSLAGAVLILAVHFISSFTVVQTQPSLTDNLDIFVAAILYRLQPV